ncbi:MAG: hypothetical protein AAGA80_02940 [Cyanobacteria bacterium P01_F01_bin.143]
MAEGFNSNELAVIGRVVAATPEEPRSWSVVAIVSRGRDDRGRTFSVYRYFLSEGKDSLWKILAWMEKFENATKRKPVFNPLEQKKVGEAFKLQVTRPDFPPVPNWLDKRDAPIVFSPNSPYNFQQINMLSNYKASHLSQPISWAVNVEALEIPGAFIVIKAASDRAVRFFNNAASSTASAAPVNFDVQRLKSNIKRLMSSSSVSEAAVNDIAQGMAATVAENGQIPFDYWESLFEAEGAKRAIQQKIYSASIVRLITLQAIIIPETLPNFLYWLSCGHNNDIIKLSLDFQVQFSKAFPYDKKDTLEKLLESGIVYLLDEILQEQENTDRLYKLLANSNSIWSNSLFQVPKLVEQDLEIIHNLIQELKRSDTSLTYNPNGFKCNHILWQDMLQKLHLIVKRDSSQNILLPTYLSFAKLFESLKAYKVAAYFYQISQGKVPNKLFIMSFGKKDMIFWKGILIKRNISLWNKSLSLSIISSSSVRENLGSTIFFVLLGLNLILWTLPTIENIILKIPETLNLNEEKTD